MAYEQKPGATNSEALGGAFDSVNTSSSSSVPIRYSTTETNNGYQQQPGMTGSTSDGGAFDEAGITNVNGYNNIASQKAAEASLSAASALASKNAAATSENNAAASAADAASIASSVEASVANAATSATNAANSATAASNSATAAASSASTANTKAIDAGNSATAAATSASNASSSASTATTQASAASTSATNAATSATNSANSATAAANSATSAASSSASALTSANNADTSATASATSATSAANSASSASASASTASTKATEAATSASNAATSASSASSNATAAAGSASNAAGSATAAANSASSASSSASNAANSASAANTSATNAAASEAVVEASALNAANSATNAAFSASTATTQATAAANSASNAATSASTATTQATAAATSAANAASSASSASTSASTATTKASEASNSASNAATSASNAATSASSASTSASNTAALLASFRSVMLGAFASDSAAETFAAANSIIITDGIMYENTVADKFRIYNGTAWQDYDSSAQVSQAAAALSAANAAASESAAATSAANAATSASNATTSASSASASASTATTQASNAASSASTASTSASNAATSAANAATSEANAATSASNAAATLASSLKIANNLSDLSNASTARTNLGLGTVATTAATDYATAAQGTKADSAVQPNTTPTLTGVQLSGTTTGGLLSWNDTEGTADLTMKGGNVTLQIGQESLVRILNNTGSTMTDMQVVRITGASGQRLTASLAQANSEINSASSLAVVTESIANNQQGFATVSGLVRDVNTSGFAEGAILWLSPSVAGGITTTKPVAPNHLVLIGWCVRSHAVNGSIFVNIQNGYELEELHDVLITSPTNGDVLIRNQTTGVWENKAVGSASGLQPYNANTVVDASYVHTDNNYTTAEKNKLAGIAAGAEVNVNADWNATTGDAAILNKPTLGTAAATDSTAYATAAQGAKADSAYQPNTALSATTGSFSAGLDNGTRFNKTGTGGEGGELHLEKGTTSTLSGDLVIDLYNQSIRIFDNGGTNKGASLDISTCNTSVGSTLLVNTNVKTINGSSIVGVGDLTVSAASVPWSGVTGKPTTLSGYGITDAPTSTGSGASGTWGINISGNAATVSNITGNTGLMTNRLTPTGTIDGLTTGNFRSTLFGTTTYAEAIATARWNAVPGPLSGLGAYGTMMAWGASDTQGFLAIDYNVANAKIGGGNGNSINWTATLIHSSNIGSQSVNYANTAGRAYPRRSDGGDLNFYWSGQSGQPPWLWGGSDGVNMYVYNPSNFSVNYANSAGSASSASTASYANNGARAWWNFGGYTGISFRGSYNVSSGTRNSGGNYTINLSVSLSTNATVVVSGGRYSNGTNLPVQGPIAYFSSASAINMYCGSDTTALSDVYDGFGVVFY